MKKINTNKSVIYGNGISDLKKSSKYLNEEVYFSNFSDFSEYKEGILKSVKMSYGAGYSYGNGCDNQNYNYFIPKDMVAFGDEPKKYYKPFKTIGELLDSTGLVFHQYPNTVQYLEFRSNCGDTYYLSYNGYEIDKFGTVYIHLGSLTFTLKELFNSYEYTSDGIKWLPFGVECEKDEVE